ncbi:hypothetical protein DPMN_093991 [Dreissena polymorpha]|uniref:HAT C-terminal dimerisation domain-containing protein n=1 Tax=Dreissena polymorpha TaxID=45954 RepID=A0A9D4L590_DREPO|nr:hypothetical protein DPMN_093991 [Dreissena polymorpha]
MESLLSEQQDWHWPEVADQIRGLSGKGLKLEKDQTLKRAFPAIQPLYKLGLLITVSTALVERGFFLMNKIATHDRTMLQGTLDALMRISYYQLRHTLTEDDFDDIVKLFLSKRNRIMGI